MAEIVGLVSAITAVTVTGFKIAKAISTISDELGTAAVQIRIIATDTKAVAWVLHDLKKRLKQARNVNTQTREIAEEVVTMCKLEINELDLLLMPLLANPTDDRLGLNKKLQWFFAKSKIATRRASLNSLKLTLDLFLHTMDLLGGERVEEYIEEEVHSIVKRSKTVKNVFLNAERLDRIAEAEFETMSSPPCNTELLIELEPPVDDSAGDRRDEESYIETGSTVEPGALSTTCSGRGSMNLTTSQASELELMISFTDDQLIKITDHIRMQRTVSSYALVVLRRGADGAAGRTGIPGSGNPADSIYSASSVSPDSVDETTDRASVDERPQTSRNPPVEPERKPRLFSDPSGNWQQGPTEEPILNDDPRLRDLYGSRAGQTPPSTQWPPHSNLFRGQDQIHPANERTQFFDNQNPPAPYVPMQDHEFEEMKAQLRQMMAEQHKAQEAQKQKEIEERIRQDAEDAYVRRTEQMKRAQETAKHEIEMAKAEAETAARHRIEAERQAEERRQKAQAEVIEQLEAKTRLKVLAELEEKKNAEAKQSSWRRRLIQKSSKDR